VSPSRRTKGDGGLFQRKGFFARCTTCHGPCALTTTGVPMSTEDVIDDLALAQSRWHKARREGKYFRAEWWARLRDRALDHL
jgi:hypothetical protein